MVDGEFGYNGILAQLSAMTNKNTIEFVAGKNSSALINQLAEELEIDPEVVVQKGLAFMTLYAGLKREKKGRILLEETNGDTKEIRELTL